ncbi:MAG: T9SS type A sorting domain-containing protein, partial [Candidatus Cloacimonetes bacterium]|nr:T9SS type A sorting domain-containing protein [Candidatus Cloacimonadota bacterium]
ARIKIYNIKGQLVKQFKIQNSKFKINVIEWDGKDENDKQLLNGIYFCKLLVGKNEIVRKMVLLR